MQKSTFIRQNGCKLLYEYKGHRYTVDTREKPIEKQHRIEREKINSQIQEKKLMDNTTVETRYKYSGKIPMSKSKAREILYAHRNFLYIAAEISATAHIEKDDARTLVHAIDAVLHAGGRQKGHWVEGKNPINPEETVYTCSECGSPGNWDNFCRICGAEMNE